MRITGASAIGSLGIMLVGGGINHAAALLGENGWLRVMGMALTCLTLIFAALAPFLLELDPVV